MKSNQELHKNIVRIMEQKNITQAKLARELKVSRSDISLLLKSLSQGKSITTSKLFSIANILNIDFNMITEN
ncbi:helix-turn-helix transcriptional regulator [uncultured Cetobacterium sp.]|uniref:helix-turn-helix domain-containing protein n=1 Tax=uncultured Cetobacterium sp. TaxID=527638 RepID=UPI00262D38AB|nr:helix-turn-helix transcriptional regulator [uncultured Cetobacterium sp.]